MHLSPAEFAQEALEWKALGAQVIGGCCRVGAEEIAALGAGRAD